MLPAPHLHPLAPFVRDGLGRLEQHAAFGGLFEVDAWVLTPQERIVVGLEIVSKERQPKPALSLKRAMTGPAVAPEPAQQRNHMSLQTRDFSTAGGKAGA